MAAGQQVQGAVVVDSGLDSELLRALCSGDEACVEELLTRSGGRVAISVQDAAAPWSPLQGAGASGLILGGSTALHLVAGRGHAGLAKRVCELAPSLVAARNRSLDTPLHCAAKAGHREVAACLLSRMRGSGEALQARNRLGATALFEAVRNGHAATVELLATEVPELAAVTTDDGVSPVYLAATAGSVDMVRALLRQLPDGTASSWFAGPEGRTALHAAAAKGKGIVFVQIHFFWGSFCDPCFHSVPSDQLDNLQLEIVQEILQWEHGSALLTEVDSTGKTPLHFAVLHRQPRVVDLLLNVKPTLACVPDNEGLYPATGDIRTIGELGQRCPSCYELADGLGRNFLHCAIEHNVENVVRFICREDRLFALLLNAMDDEGNTPLHLAVKHGHPRMVSLLLQTMRVKIGNTNRDGLTAADLAYRLQSSGAWFALFSGSSSRSEKLFVLDKSTGHSRVGGDHVHLHSVIASDATREEDPKDDDVGGMTASATIASVLIATVTFAAAFTMPGGYVADDHPHAGTAVPARRFAFRAFVLSDAMAFIFSIAATCFLVYGGAGQVPRSHRRFYQRSASALLPAGAQLMVSAFAFGVHVVLGDANRWLITSVYLLSLAAVLFCFPGIWAPFYLTKAIWRRAGWRGLINVHQRPTSLREFFWLFITSFLFKNLVRPLFAVLISLMFLVAIALNIALPGY